MTFKREICKNYYLCDTPIENIFIDEYMLDAPGEYVKVYLYAYMYSGLNQVMSNELMSKRLNMNIEEVLAAWTYWENMGIVRKYYPNPEDETHYDIEFINIKNALYSSNSASASGKSKSTSVSKAMADDELASLYKEIESITGRMSDPSNMLKIAELVDVDGADPSIISFAYRYCKENNNPTDFKYVSAIVKKWLENNLHTVKDVKEFIEESDNRFAEYRQIMKALGLSPAGITEEEKRTFNSWLDEMGFSLAFILEVCGKAAGMGHKYSYVKKVLSSEYEKQGQGSSPVPKVKTLNDRQKYYEQIRADNQQKTKERREEVYSKIPRIGKIEEELRSLGMEIGRIMVSGADNKQEAAGLAKQKTQKLQEEKKDLLVGAGFPKDYMEDVYNCYICKDTGIQDDGGHCSCYTVSTE